MKIVNFKAEKVHGYLDININFQEDLTILTGSNGSGKSSALLLIHALITPNFTTLLTTPFVRVSVDLTHNHSIFNLTAIDRGDSIHLHISFPYRYSYIEEEYNRLEKPLEINKVELEEFEYYLYKKQEYSDLNDVLNRKYQGHPVLNFLRRIPSPLFLGLDRRDINKNSEYDEFHYNREPRITNKTKKTFKGSLGLGLMETELMVQDTFRRIKTLEDHYLNKLKDQILLSSFDYIEFKQEDLHFSLQQDKMRIINRKDEIIDAIKKLTISEEILEKTNDFFKKISILFGDPNLPKTKDKNNNDGMRIELLTNKAQFERLLKILKTIDDHNSRLATNNKPIDQFTSTVNKFLKDSGKKLQINKVGHLEVIKPNGSISNIESLSSGERQLLIIFAHIFLGKYDSQSEVFMVDEPELSLHIRWQELFINTVLQSSKRLQFILATHSPDIIGDHIDKSINLVNKNRL